MQSSIPNCTLDEFQAFNTKTNRLPKSISFRPIRENDKDFLCRLYATTRADEMAMVPWSEKEKSEFLSMQFNAQHQYYHGQFSDADFLIISQDAATIGRVYIQRRVDEIRLIDIALLPEHRGSGLGTQLLNELLLEAEQKQLPVRIHVEHFNPALRLYERLGFQQIEDQGVYYLMEWNSDAW